MKAPPWLFIARGEMDRDVASDWDRWYDETHLPEILACPGFVRASRYVAEEGGTQHFLTLYEVEHAGVMETPEFANNRGMGSFGDRGAVRSRVYRHHVSRERTN